LTPQAQKVIIKKKEEIGLIYKDLKEKSKMHKKLMKEISQTN